MADPSLVRYDGQKSIWIQDQAHMTPDLFLNTHNQGIVLKMADTFEEQPNTATPLFVFQGIHLIKCNSLHNFIRGCV